MATTKPRRNSAQRRAILEELMKVRSHPTAAELYEITRRRLPRISLGTVYRNLEILIKMGLARKLETAGREARFDGNLEPHYHARCVHCGEVEDIHGSPRDLVSEEITRKTTFRILEHRLELLGICPDCAEKGEELEN